MELKEGSRAPSFKAVDDKGKPISLSQFSGKRVVLYFYPKDMTSGCTQEACDFQELSDRFRKLGTQVVGVSKDSIERHQNFKKKYGLKFTLISDGEGELCEKYGVWKEKSLYGRKYMGIERTTFIIGPDGKVEKVYPKVKVRDHAASVLEELGGSALAGKKATKKVTKKAKKSVTKKKTTVRRKKK